MNTQQNTNMNPVESTSLFHLSWREECCDEGDNSIYEAASPYYDDGSPFYFRIRQRLRDNKHEFYEASDSEVMMDDEDPRTWESLDAAKAAMQADADDMVREHSGRTTAQTMKTEATVRPREAGAGLDELEAALQVLVRHAGRDGGYSPYYGQWQDILHGLGRLIASKRRDLPNKGSTNE